MFKKVIALITALFLSGCSASDKYIELPAIEFKHKLHNINNDYESWIVLAHLSNEDKEFYYFNKVSNNTDNNDSVINIIERIKVSKNSINVLFNDEAGFSSRRIKISNIVFL